MSQGEGVPAGTPTRPLLDAWMRQADELLALLDACEAPSAALVEREAQRARRRANRARLAQRAQGRRGAR